jgi:hypothetical protein
MMKKLQAQVWKSPDTSMFHVLMNKGTSVYVFCYRRYLNAEQMLEEAPTSTCEIRRTKPRT